MNRKEAELFEDIFISRGILQRIDPDMDVLDVVQSYEELALPDAVDKLTNRLIRYLEHRDCGWDGSNYVN